MKLKFIHKIYVIQEKFLLFFNLLRGPDIRRSGPDPAAGCHPWCTKCLSCSLRIAMHVAPAVLGLHRHKFL